MSSSRLIFLCLWGSTTKLLMYFVVILQGTHNLARWFTWTFLTYTISSIGRWTMKHCALSSISFFPARYRLLIFTAITVPVSTPIRWS